MRWLAFALYGIVCGVAISLVGLIHQPATQALPLLLCGLCPAPLAFVRGLNRWSVIGAAALIFAVDLLTVNLVSSYWYGKGYDSALLVLIVGFVFLFPLIALPVTFFSWAAIDHRRRRQATLR